LAWGSAARERASGEDGGSMNRFYLVVAFIGVTVLGFASIVPIGKIIGG